MSSLKMLCRFSVVAFLLIVCSCSGGPGSTATKDTAGIPKIPPSHDSNGQVRHLGKNTR